jgi:hypothetical protein
MDVISQQKIVNIFGLLLIFAGLGIVVVQIFLYLKNGQWVELPLLYLTILGPDKFVSWLDNPISWIGFHKIIYGFLNAMPLSLCSMLIGKWLIIEV